MKNLLLLGATGSIGEQTLDVLRLSPHTFSVFGVSASGKRRKELENILQEFSPQYAHVFDEITAKNISKKFPNITILTGEQGLQEITALEGAAYVVNALPGETGLTPSKIAIEQGKTLLLANKESLVIAGQELLKKSKQTSAKIISLDSEHSALWQILQERNLTEIEKIFLTCSGGPFRDAKKWPLPKLATVTTQQALHHPTWKMGPKISIDSATLMNKAFELIEMVRLFDLSPETVEVVIHPQSIVHSAVQFQDGQILAQMGPPDMRLIIAYGLFEGTKRIPLPFQRLDLFAQNLSFEQPDETRFPSLQLARIALHKGEAACAKLCRNNDRAVQMFLDGEIGFLDIFEICREEL